MTGKTKTIFETLGKYAGIQVLWDPNYTAPAHDTFTVDFHQSTLDQALDSVALLSKSNWKRLSPTVIFVTNDNGPPLR
jgi:general secretion pathway protein D